jgi:hypothetical protein
MKSASIYAIVFIFLVLVMGSCKPSTEQLQKEKERTEAIVKEATAPLQLEIANLKNDIKATQLRAEIENCKTRLQQYQKPRELTKQSEEADLIEAEQQKIVDLESQLNALQVAPAMATDTMATK